VSRLLELPSVKDWPEPRRRKAVNTLLYKLGFNQWYQSIPTTEIADILTRFGFDASVMEGIYTGRDGRMHEQIKDSRLWLTMTWHAMPSGRYEIVAYVN
jgi:hypothetical protein